MRKTEGMHEGKGWRLNQASFVSRQLRTWNIALLVLFTQCSRCQVDTSLVKFY